MLCGLALLALPIVGAFDVGALDVEMRRTIEADQAFQGNPLESATVVRAPFKKVIKTFSELAEKLPEDPHNLKLQAKSLKANKKNLFWYHGFKWQLPRALKASAADESQAEESAEETNFKSGIYPRLLDPELRKKQIQEFNDNDRIIYVEDFFDEQTFARMQQEASRMWSSTDLEINCNLDGVNRLGGYVLDPDATNQNSFYNLIYANLDLASWASTIYESPMFPSDFPIELREYGVKSTGMPCHRDLALYKDVKRDAEFLFTLFNNSTCQATYVDAKGVEHSLQTKANSLIMVQPNAALHCVVCQPTTPGGIREVMKWIYTGSYAKHRDFDSYAANRCGSAGLNFKELLRRRSTEEVKIEKNEL
eukprot:GEMP01037221.1.p1 GENE.GEMP01037221.1~~GEMP01037221.1.p1  ORF type:complete len:365 (+),score=60.61 GEMP01037221.1:110-1204(+)